MHGVLLARCAGNDGPCQWPHHTAVVPAPPDAAQPDVTQPDAMQPDGQRRAGGPVPISIRTVFACAPGEEDAVHDRVAVGLHAGQVPGEDAGWVVLSIERVEMAAGERALANRLVGR